MRMKIHFIGRGIKRSKTVVNTSPKNNKKQQAFFRKKGKGGFNPQQLSFQGKADTIHSSKTDSKEEVHKEIISLVNWAKNNNILNQSLASFIVNQGWIDLKAIKDGKVVNYNVNSIKLI